MPKEQKIIMETKKLEYIRIWLILCLLIVIREFWRNVGQSLELWRSWSNFSRIFWRTDTLFYLCWLWHLCWLFNRLIVSFSWRWAPISVDLQRYWLLSWCINRKVVLFLSSKHSNIDWFTDPIIPWSIFIVCCRTKIIFTWASC